MGDQGKTTESLEAILETASVSDIDGYLKEHADKIHDEEHPFAAFMRKTLQLHEIRQQDLFIAADISERYGYKIISEEKHTRQRDVIIRLCLAGRFTLTEVQRALKLYGMNELYAKIPRDAVLIIAFNREIFDLHEVDALLASHSMQPLYECRSAE